MHVRAFARARVCVCVRARDMISNLGRYFLYFIYSICLWERHKFISLQHSNNGEIIE